MPSANQDVHTTFCALVQGRVRARCGAPRALDHAEAEWQYMLSSVGLVCEWSVKEVGGDLHGDDAQLLSAHRGPRLEGI